MRYLQFRDGLVAVGNNWRMKKATLLDKEWGLTLSIRKTKLLVVGSREKDD